MGTRNVYTVPGEGELFEGNKLDFTFYIIFGR
jgi:hypothetical protein